MRLDLAAEISRVREIETATIKREEAAKYREKMNQYIKDLERVHYDKLEKLKQREEWVEERCKRREQELEGA